MRINPYFELNGNRYELTKTQYIVAEYNRLTEENPISSEDRAYALKASNLNEEVQRCLAQTKSAWDKLCKEPTEENKNAYNIFKSISNETLEEYNNLVSNSDGLVSASKKTNYVLEQVAIKAIAEQYFNLNENSGKKLWLDYKAKVNNEAKINEWLNAMGQCLFAEDDEEEDEGFLSQVRKLKKEKKNAQREGFLKRR